MNGYVPVQYDGGNGQFWGRLLDDQWQPSEIFCRLSDSVFFYLDRYAQVQGQNTGFIEPMKSTWWTIAVSGDRPAVHLVESRLTGLYDLGRVPYQLVPVEGGTPIPILDRRGFLESLVSTFKVDPSYALQKLNKTISTFGLVDPATNQRFPSPIPASAVPANADWNMRSAYSVWRMSMGIEVQTQQREAALAGYKKKQRRASMLHTGSNLFQNLMGGGSGGSGGGFGGTGLGGGGTTGFGF